MQRLETFACGRGDSENCAAAEHTTHTALVRGPVQVPIGSKYHARQRKRAIVPERFVVETVNRGQLACFGGFVDGSIAAVAHRPASTGGSVEQSVGPLHYRSIREGAI